MCKCAETKREALDGVKPSWCHFSSDRRFLSLNLSSEELRDKYRDSRLLRIKNTRDSGCMHFLYELWIYRLRDEDNFVGQVLYAAACSLVTGRAEHLKEFRAVVQGKLF